MGDTEKKTLRFAGRDIDQSEFVRRAQAKVNEWMDYQGLKGDQRSDFMRQFNDQLAGITNGQYTINDSGEVVGATDTGKLYYGEQTGRYKKNGKPTGGWIPIVERDGFNPSGNVVTYLNGIAGAMPEIKKPSTKKKYIGPEEYVKQQVFGDSNPTDTGYIRWADALDVADDKGMRSINNRSNEIKKYAETLKTLIDNNTYEFDSDDAKSKALLELQLLIDQDGPSWRNHNPWLDNYLFTGRTYQTPEQLAQQQPAQQQIIDQETAYIQGVDGATNPYNQSEDPKNYNRVEQERAKRLEQKVLTDFQNIPIDTNFVDDTNTKKIFKTRFNTVTPGSINDNVSPYAWNPMRFIEDALTGISNENKYGQDVLTNKWEMFHDDETGYGTGDTSLLDELSKSNNSLSAYFNQISTDDMPDDNTFASLDGYNARSNTAYKVKMVADYVLANTSENPNYFSWRDNGNGIATMPELIDWKNNKIYVVRILQNSSRLVEIEKMDLRTFLNQITSSSPIYKSILKMYLIRNNIQTDDSQVVTNKNGGILKANDGTKVNYHYDSTYSPVGKANEGDGFADYDRAKQIGDKQFSREWKDSQTKFTTIDKLRFGTIAADLIATLASATGNSVAGGIVGGASTLTNLGLDIADDNVSFWDAAKGLGMGLAFDALKLIPGVGATGGIAKVVKNIVKWAPKIAIGLELVNSGPGAASTLKKIVEGNWKNVNAGEWREFARSMNMLAAGSAIGRNAYDRRLGKYKNLKQQDTQHEFTYTKKDGSTGKVSLTTKEIREFNEIGKTKGQNEAIAWLKTKTGDDVDLNSMGADFSHTGWAKRFKNTSLKPTDKGTPVYNNASIKASDLAEVERIRQLGPVRKAFVNKFGTQYQAESGGKKAFNERIKSYEQADKAAEENKALSSLKEGVAKIKEHDEAVSEAQNDLNKAREFAAIQKKNWYKYKNFDKDYDREFNELIKLDEQLKTDPTNKILRAKFNRQQKKVEELDEYNKTRKSLNGDELRTKYLNSNKDLREATATYNTVTQKKVFTNTSNELSHVQNTIQERLNNNEYQNIFESKNFYIQNNENFKRFILELFETIKDEEKIKNYLINKDFMSRMRKQYKFKKGGILKAQPGEKVPETTKQQEETNPKQQEGVKPDGGRTAKKNNTTPKDPINPWITALEEQSYRDAINLNSKIVDLAQQLKVPHSTPVTINYKTHSAKDLTDQAQAVRNRYNEAGARATKNISDQGLANAIRLANMTAGENAAGSYELQASTQNRADADKATEVANTNDATRIQTADKNKAADIAKYNQDIEAVLQGLNKLGTQRQQHAKVIEAGLAQSSILAYDQAKNAAVANDPIVLSLKPRYEELAKKYTNGTLTDDEEKEYHKLAYDIQQAQQNALTAFRNKYREPNTRPYGYYYDYVTPTERGAFNFGYSSTGFFKTGGKMEAAEIEKTRREYAKLFHDTQKFLVSESNKKLKNSGLAYFRKLMMQKS